METSTVPALTTVPGSASATPNCPIAPCPSNIYYPQCNVHGTQYEPSLYVCVFSVDVTLPIIEL